MYPLLGQHLCNPKSSLGNSFIQDMAVNYQCIINYSSIWPFSQMSNVAEHSHLKSNHLTRVQTQGKDKVQAPGLKGYNSQRKIQMSESEYHNRQSSLSPERSFNVSQFLTLPMNVLSCSHSKICAFRWAWECMCVVTCQVGSEHLTGFVIWVQSWVQLCLASHLHTNTHTQSRVKGSYSKPLLLAKN